MPDHRIVSRREFLGRSTSCVAHLGLLAGVTPGLMDRLWAPAEPAQVVVEEPWGRLERVGEGVWALVSTPFGDRTTLCNGGIVAGRAGVVVIESFGSDRGARWMAEQARLLVGRPPTHVVLTHYHGDHTGGLRGSVGEGDGVEVLATAVTRDQVRDRNDGAPVEILDAVRVLGARRPTEIDLGDRSLILVPRRGHTDSDVTIEVTDPPVVFCGDLVWNRMFPNYVDASPARLTQAVRLIRLEGASTFVPGHGPLADAAALDLYLGLLEDVEAAARAAIERGTTAAEAGAAYSLPRGLEDWTLFNPAYFERAIGAWMRELAG